MGTRGHMRRPPEAGFTIAEHCTAQLSPPVYLNASETRVVGLLFEPVRTNEPEGV